MPTKPPLKISDASGLVDELQATDQVFGLRLGETDPSKRNKRWSLQTLADYVRGNFTPIETSAGIKDATAAGRAMLTAQDAAAQLTLVDSIEVAADLSIGRPNFTRAYTGNGAILWLIQKVSLLLSQAAPATGPSPTVTGFLASSGPVGGTVTIRGTLFTGAISVAFNGTPAPFQVVNATTIIAEVPVGATTGPISVSNDTLTGTSAASFTVGAAVVTQPTPTQPTPTQPAAPTFSGFDDVANTVSVSHATLPVSELVYDFNGATGIAVPTNNVISVGNLAGQVTAYAKATSTRPEGVRANSQPFTVTAAVNDPAVSLSSPQAGQSLTVGDPYVLNAAPVAGSNPIAKVEFLSDGQKFAETTAAPHTIQGNITAGAHSFTARVLDMIGKFGFSAPVAITGVAAGTPTLVPITGYSAAPFQDGIAQQLSTAVANATSYTFEIATDAGFTVAHQTASQTGLTKNWLGLTAGTLYYTRVTATAPGYVSSVATASATTAPAVARVNMSSIAGIPNDADLSMESQQFGTDGTAAIQAFFDSYGNNFAEIYCDVKASATNLVLPSSVRITFAPGCGFIQRPNAGGDLIRNRNFRGMNAQKNGLAARVDQLVVLDGGIINGNGYLGSTAQQPHDTAPGNGVLGGWTIPIRLAGVETVVVTNLQSLNQTTFAGFISNAGTITNRGNVVKSNPSRPRNSDGWKHMAFDTLRCDQLSGFTGDDISSADSADIFYDVWPLPAHQGAGQVGYDPAAVWGPIGNIEYGTVDLQDSGFGLRFTSSTIETKISSVFIQRLQGTSRNQPLIFDNYAEDPSALFGPAGGRPGYLGNVNIRELVAELTGSTSYKPATCYINSYVDEFRVGYVQRRIFGANNYPTFLVDSGSRITNFIVESGSFIPNVANNTGAILAVSGYIGTAQLSNSPLDYRGVTTAGTPMNFPLVRMLTGGRIDKLYLTNCAGYNVQNLVELYYGGSIGEIYLDGILFQPGAAADFISIVFVNTGFTVAILQADNLTPGSQLYAGQGTVTSVVLPHPDAITQPGTYEDDGPYMSRTGGWAHASGSYHSGGHAFTSTDTAQEHYTYLNLSVAVTPTFISGTFQDWGSLEVLLDDQPYCVVSQHDTSASFHVTPATRGALAPIPPGPHKLTRRPLTAGKLTSVDGLQLA